MKIFEHGRARFNLKLYYFHLIRINNTIIIINVDNYPRELLSWGIFYAVAIAVETNLSIIWPYHSLKIKILLCSIQTFQFSAFENYYFIIKTYQIGHGKLLAIVPIFIREIYFEISLSFNKSNLL